MRLSHRMALAGEACLQHVDSARCVWTGISVVYFEGRRSIRIWAGLTEAYGRRPLECMMAASFGVPILPRQ